MKKNKGKGSFIAPRNGHVASVMFKSGAGAHDKPYKTKRQIDKMKLRKAIKDIDPRGQNEALLVNIFLSAA